MAHTRHRLRSHFGFSLVEVMIAITIGLLLLAGLSLIFMNTSNANKELQKTAQQIENGRYAIDMLTEDLRLAGFYGHLHELPTAPASLSDPCETSNTTNLLNALAFPIQGYTAPDLSSVPDVTATTCDDQGLLIPSNMRAGSDVLVVRRANTVALAATDTAVTNDVYIQASGSQADVQIGNGAQIGTNKASGGASTILLHNGAPAPIRKYEVHVYFVAPCSNGSGTNGVCQRGDDTIPTLKRLELVSIGGVAQMNVVPLVEGVEYLKLEYGVDNIPNTANPATSLIGDSTVDAYTTAPADWTTVIAAKLYLLARNTEASMGFTDTKSYALGAVTVPAANDQFKRHAYVSAVRLVSPAGRREIP